MRCAYCHDTLDCPTHEERSEWPAPLDREFYIVSVLASLGTFVLCVFAFGLVTLLAKFGRSDFMEAVASVFFVVAVLGHLFAVPVLRLAELHGHLGGDRPTIGDFARTSLWVGLVGGVGLSSIVFIGASVFPILVVAALAPAAFTAVGAYSLGLRGGRRDDSRRDCPECGTYLHLECWRLMNSRCPTLGCRRRPGLRRPLQPQVVALRSRQVFVANATQGAAAS